MGGTGDVLRRQSPEGKSGLVSVQGETRYEAGFPGLLLKQMMNVSENKPKGRNGCAHHCTVRIKVNFYVEIGESITNILLRFQILQMMR